MNSFKILKIKQKIRQKATGGDENELQLAIQTIFPLTNSYKRSFLIIHYKIFYYLSITFVYSIIQ